MVSRMRGDVIRSGDQVHLTAGENTGLLLHGINGQALASAEDEVVVRMRSESLLDPIFLT